MLSLSLAQGNFLAAVKNFERDYKTFFTPRGEPVYSQAEHAKRKAELLATLKAVAQEAAEAVQDARADAETLLTWQDADPILTLGGPDLERAAQLRPFIQEFCATAKFVDLASRLEYVVQHGDTPAKALFVRYTAPRITNEALSKLPQDDNRLFDGLESCKQAVATLAAELTPPKAKQAIDEAAKLRTQAAEIERLVIREVGRIDGSLEAHEKAFANALHAML